VCARWKTLWLADCPLKISVDFIFDVYIYILHVYICMVIHLAYHIAMSEMGRIVRGILNY